MDGPDRNGEPRPRRVSLHIDLHVAIVLATGFEHVAVPSLGRVIVRQEDLPPVGRGSLGAPQGIAPDADVVVVDPVHDRVFVHLVVPGEHGADAVRPEEIREDPQRLA